MSYWETQRADKEALLIASWKAGHTAREIAAALHARFGGKVSRNAVVSKAHRLKLPMHQNAHAWRGMSIDRRRG